MQSPPVVSRGHGLPCRSFKDTCPLAEGHSKFAWEGPVAVTRIVVRVFPRQALLAVVAADDAVGRIAPTGSIPNPRTVSSAPRPRAGCA
jgi:hypothetical protein